MYGTANFIPCLLPTPTPVSPGPCGLHSSRYERTMTDNSDSRMIKRMRLLFYLVRKYRNFREVFNYVDRGKRPVRLVFWNGISIRAPQDLPLLEVAHEVFWSKDYTPPGFEIGSDFTVVDIGANVGIFSIYAARRTKRMIHAYEPFPTAIEYLRTNLKSNGIQNVVIHQCAVSHQEGSAKLFLSNSIGGHRLFQANDQEVLHHSVEVPAITLPEIMEREKIEIIHHLKMDCEGAEGAILSSTPRDYLRRIQRIALEFHDNVSPLNHEEIRALLEKSGFFCSVRWESKFPVGYIYARSN
jgi:FkbM family methyltransferase